jgi:hypothetical protein
MPFGVFFHDASDETFFDVHLRVKAAPALAIAASAAPTPIRRRGRKTAARIKAASKAAWPHRPGSMNWSYKNYLANVDLGADPLLKMSSTTFYEIWPDVVELLRRDDPPEN